jgi:hypothetical protein
MKAQVSNIALYVTNSKYNHAFHSNSIDMCQLKESTIIFMREKSSNLLNYLQHKDKVAP